MLEPIETRMKPDAKDMAHTFRHDPECRRRLKRVLAGTPMPLELFSRPVLRALGIDERTWRWWEAPILEGARIASRRRRGAA
jgi:hypothetical protein